MVNNGKVRHNLRRRPYKYNNEVIRKSKKGMDMEANKQMDLINLNQGIFDFKCMSTQIFALLKQYPFLKYEVIGKSVEGRPLYMLSLGEGKKRIHVNGSHHGNEWITSFVVMKSIEIMCKAYEKQCEVREENIRDLLHRVSYDFVPMVNPDGVELAIHGLKGSPNTYKNKKLMKCNEGEMNFSRWKANIRGVDLNRNYAAGFADYVRISEKAMPSYAYYAGCQPESEPESRALAYLTRKRNYEMVFAYHTQGEVIYWTYDNLQVETALEYATIFSKASGYALDEPDALAASGGYKDWFIKAFHKPGFTIECGWGENPIDSSQGLNIVEQTLPILLLAAQDIRKEG